MNARRPRQGSGLVPNTYFGELGITVKRVLTDRTPEQVEHELRELADAIAGAARVQAQTAGSRGHFP